MLTKRIIPCLDVKDGRTVKGTKFLDLRDAGDPVELAKRYSKDGADELIFLDIGATIEKRQALKELVERVAAELDIPFTVGGGIASIEDIDVLLSAGADKVSINSAAVRDPELISIASRNYGSQCIVIAIDAKKVGDHFIVFINGGRISTELDAEVWCRRAIDLGAGEILLTSMDADGTKNGFDIELTRRIASAVNVPVIASGGAGSPRDFVDVFTTASADAALAAGIFHFGEVEIPLLKDFLRGQGIPVRI